jgi:hypothetical protein
MGYDVEDEVDWSDGPLGPASPEDFEPHAGPSQYAPNDIEAGYSDQPFMSTVGGHYQLPLGSPLPFSRSS